MIYNTVCNLLKRSRVISLRLRRPDPICRTVTICAPVNTGGRLWMRLHGFQSHVKNA
jgi:hypothetical protein